ncbi:hypothetical protein BDP27DRAFT_1483679 [Rhodocollybia butyracea]|uniref:Uncharacterized protein n=1 Tax=Rhodocollybia butyracea TaxID=206335 RepID=A0A9P5UBR4_9AGAR|nr:hypothetical protein BDP27DRAFT_1483679 [Rhodocollybia butyracea]
MTVNGDGSINLAIRRLQFSKKRNYYEALQCRRSSRLLSLRAALSQFSNCFLMFDDDELLPPWSSPDISVWVIRSAFSFVLLAPYAPWKASPATQDLEATLGDFEKTVQKLRKTAKKFPSIPRYLLPDYRLFRKKFSRLRTSTARFRDAHRTFASADLLLGPDIDKATPHQWNLRAQMARSDIWYHYYPPLERKGRPITFPPDAPSMTITRGRVVQFNYLNPNGVFRVDTPADDTWTPNVPYISESAGDVLSCLHNPHPSLSSPRNPNTALPTSNVCSKCEHTLPPRVGLASLSPPPPPSYHPPPPYNALLLLLRSPVSK